MNLWNCWLNHFQSKLQVFIENEEIENLKKLERLYNPAKLLPLYALEIPLQGIKTCDFSALITPKNLIQNTTEFACNEKWYELSKFYVNDLEKRNNEELKNGAIYLEIDSSKGEKKASLFFYIKRYYDLIPQLIVQSGINGRLKYIDDILSNFGESASLMHLGLMTTRKDSPIRLVFKVKNFDDILSKIKGYGINVPVQSIKLINSFSRYYNVFIDLDIFENGIGPTLGLEIIMPENLFNEPLDRYDSFIEYMASHHNVDDRIFKVIDLCNTTEFYDKKRNDSYSIESGISHFKLQWNKQRELPSKVYIKIRGKNL